MDKEMSQSLGYPWRDGEALSVGSADPMTAITSISIAPDLGQDQSISGMAEQLKNSIRDDRKYRSDKVQ